jgi:hypothetical protein
VNTKGSNNNTNIVNDKVGSYNYNYFYGDDIARRDEEEY